MANNACPVKCVCVFSGKKQKKGENETSKFEAEENGNNVRLIRRHY
jgi:hypothetical protein